MLRHFYQYLKVWSFSLSICLMCLLILKLLSKRFINLVPRSKDFRRSSLPQNELDEPACSWLIYGAVHRRLLLPRGEKAKLRVRPQAADTIMGGFYYVLFSSWWFRWHQGQEIGVTGVPDLQFTKSLAQASKYILSSPFNYLYEWEEITQIFLTSCKLHSGGGRKTFRKNT